MENGVLIPVKWEHVEAVRSLLNQLNSKEGTPKTERGESEKPKDATEKWPKWKLRLIFEDCTPAVQRILLKLAEEENEGDWVYGTTLMEEAAPAGGSKNIGSYLKSLGAAVKRHHDEHEWPIKLHKDERTRLYQYKMEPEVAKYIREFGD